MITILENENENNKLKLEINQLKEENIEILKKRDQESKKVVDEINEYKENIQSLLSKMICLGKYSFVFHMFLSRNKKKR